ncbi:MAG: hypothetical protein ACRDJ1_09680 [Actinomycetota bacterium]
MSSRRDPGTFARLLAALSLSSAVLVAAVLLIVPSYSGVEAVVSTTGESFERSTSATLLQANGAGVLVPLLFPAAVAGLAILAAQNVRLRSVSYAVATSILLVFVFLTGFSIGLFFIPSAALMAFAAGKAKEAHRGEEIEGI